MPIKIRDRVFQHFKDAERYIKRTKPHIKDANAYVATIERRERDPVKKNISKSEIDKIVKKMLHGTQPRRVTLSKKRKKKEARRLSTYEMEKKTARHRTILQCASLLDSLK